MTGHRASRLWIGLWAVLALVGCGSDGEVGEDLNLAETQIGAASLHAAVAMAPDGRFAVTWRPNSNTDGKGLVQMQRFTAGGFKDGPVITVSQVVQSGSSSLSHVTFGPQGESFVTWTDRGNIYVQRYGADGSPSGAPSLVHSSNSSSPVGIDIGPTAQGVVLWGGRTGSGPGAWRLMARLWDPI